MALIPWLAALDRVRGARAAAIAGLVMCEVFTVSIFFWFAPAMAHYAEAPLAAGFLVLVVLAPLLQPQWIPFALARVLVRARRGFWFTALTGAAVYVGSEWLFPKLFADTLGHGLFASPRLRQLADIAGAPGLTFVLILANECALAVLRGVVARRRVARPAVAAPAVGLALLVTVPLLYGELRLRQLQGAAGAPISAGLVQADLSHYSRLAKEMSTYDAVRMILDTHFSLSRQALERGPLDLLIWAETVYPTTFGTPKSEDGAAFDREIAGFVARSGTPLLFGSYDVEDGHEFNAAVLLEPGPPGKMQFDTYRKAKLFPFTERVPSWIDTPALRAAMPWAGTWRPGSGSSVLTMHLRDGRPLTLAPLICYDAIDPMLAIEAARQGADAIVTISNDSWFDEGDGPHLHLVVSAFRSLETRRPQLRVTTTGISAVISPTGELVETLAVHDKGVLVPRIAPAAPGTTTLMIAWGDWFGPTAGALASVLLVSGLTLRARDASRR